MSSGSISSAVAMFPKEIIVKGVHWGSGDPMELIVHMPVAEDNEAIVIQEVLSDEVIFDGFGSPILTSSLSEFFLSINVKLLERQEDGNRWTIKIEKKDEADRG